MDLETRFSQAADRLYAKPDNNPQQPEIGALLDTIAGTESPDYNTMYGGSKFEGYDDHPRIGHVIQSGPNRGKTSKAAGRYQFTEGTWDDQQSKLKLPDFSPESQDKAAWNLAEDNYLAKTGRNLLEDLRSGDTSLHHKIGEALNDTWTSLPGGIEATTSQDRFSREYLQNLNARLGVSTWSAVKQNPDAHARDLQLSRDTGLSMEAVQQDPKRAEQLRNLQTIDNQNLTQSAPVTASQMADPDFAGVAFDDVDNLSAIEKLIHYGTNAGEAFKSGLYGMGEGALGVAQGVGAIVDRVRSPLADHISRAHGAESFFDEQRYLFERERKAHTPKARNAIEAGVYSGIASIAQSLALLPAGLVAGSALPVLLPMAGIAGGMAYGEDRAKNVGVGTSLLHGLSDGLIEAATEQLPAGRLVEDLAAKAPLLNIISRQIAPELAGEQVATHLQDLNAWAVQHPDKPFADYLKERPSAALQTLVGAAVGMGGTVGTLKGAQMLMTRKTKQVEDGGTAGVAVKQLDGLVKASKVAARDPASFEKFMQSVEQEGPVDTLYIGANQLYQTGMVEALSVVSPSIAAQYPGALLTGGQVAIPVSEFASKIAPTELSKPLLDHLRIDPDGMSAAEAQAALDEHTDVMQSAIDDAINGVKNNDAFRASVEAVHADVMANLTDIARFRPEVNELYAMLHSSYAAVRAAQLGILPEDFYRGHMLTVVAQKPGQTVEESPEILNKHRKGAYNPETNTITLLQDADFTTFLHESAHFFFENDMGVASGLLGKPEDTLTEGDREIMGDVSVLLNWHGIPGDLSQQLDTWLTMDPEERRAYHERTAESFERYLFEGKAPSFTLQRAFRLFRSWLTSVYKNLKTFIGGHPEAAKLNDDVRRIFDRMLATAEEIDLATKARSMMPLFETPEQVGWTPDQYAAYHRLTIAQAQQAIEGLQARTLKDLQWLDRARTRHISRLKREYRQARREVQGEVTTEIMNQPVYRAWRYLTGKPQQIDEVADWKERRKAAGEAERLREESGIWKQSPEYRQQYDKEADRDRARARVLREAKAALADATKRGMTAFEASNPHPEQNYLDELAQWEAGKQAAMTVARSAGLNTKPKQRAINAEQAALDYETAHPKPAKPATTAETGPESMHYGKLDWTATRSYLGLTRRAMPKEKKRMIDNEVVQPEHDSLVQAIAKLGGFNIDYASKALGVDVAKLPKSGVFGKPLIRKTGGSHSLDDMAEALGQDGYLTLDEHGKPDPYELLNKFHNALNGGEEYSSQKDYSHDMAVEAFELEGDRISQIPHVREIWKTLTRYEMLTDENGETADTVAIANGMSSGDELLQKLADAVPPKDAITAETDKRMMERYGDVNTPEALQEAADLAVHNELRARVIAAEQDALSAVLEAKEPTGKKNAKGQILTRKILPAAAKAFAEDAVSRLLVKNVKPLMYRNAEMRAAKAAAKAERGGEIEQAFNEKRNELLQHYLGRAADAAKDDITKGLQTIRKLMTGKGRKAIPQAYLDQIDRILEGYQFKAVTAASKNRQSYIDWWLSQVGEGLDPELDPAIVNNEARQSYRDLTVEEFRGLVDTLNQIAFMGRQHAKSILDRDKREFAALKEDVIASIEAHANGRRLDPRTATTNVGRLGEKLLSFAFSHAKATHVLRAMDGDQAGTLSQLLAHTATDRNAWEVSQRAAATVKLTELFNPISKLPGWGGSGQWFDSINRSLNRESRMVFALNSGNAGNLKRLLDGESWGFDQIRPVLESLTAEEWDAVQGIWDHFESYRPEIAAQYLRLYGKEPEWIDPVPFEVRLPDGTTKRLKGGYYPVKYDPKASQRADENYSAEKAKQEMEAARTMATTRNSYTKSRASQPNMGPLVYTLTGMYQGVNEVIHDLAWREWGYEANRLLRSRDVGDAIRMAWGYNIHKQLKDWVSAILIGDHSIVSDIDKALALLRQNIATTTMAFNVGSAIKQVFGYGPSAGLIGPEWLAVGMSQVLAGRKDAAELVTGKSEFMRNRARTQMRELREIMTQIRNNNGYHQKIGKYGFYLMTHMQQLVDLPTWLGAYQKAYISHGDEDLAVNEANQAVMDAQGDGSIMALTAAERGDEAYRMLSMFYNYMGTSLNVMALKGSMAFTHKTPKAWAEFGQAVLYTAILPVMAETVIMGLLQPSGGDDESLARKLADKQIEYLMGLFLLVREFTGTMVALSGGKAFDYAGPAGFRAVADTSALGEQISQGEIDAALTYKALAVIGDFTGLPSGQLIKTLKGTDALIEGKTVNPAAVALGYRK